MFHIVEDITLGPVVAGILERGEKIFFDYWIYFQKYCEKIYFRNRVKSVKITNKNFIGSDINSKSICFC